MLRSFVTRVTEHQALIACAHFFRLLRFLRSAVNAGSDVRRLLAEHVDDGAGVTVKTNIRIVITDTVDDVTRQIFDIDPSRCGDFTGNDGGTRLYQRFARNTGALVLREDRIENRIGNLIGNFVRMAFRDRFRGKEVVRHLNIL